MRKPTTRSTILMVARTLFARHGYDGTSMERIARGVGVRKASLYAHFPGKQALFREVFDGVLHEYRTHLEKTALLPRGDAPIQKGLAGIFGTYVGYFADPDAMSFWYRAFMSPPQFMKQEITESTMQVESTFVDRLTGLFRESMKEGRLRPQSPSRVSMAFYQMLVGFGMTVAYSPRMNVSRLVRECLDVLWQGIGPSGARREGG